GGGSAAREVLYCEILGRSCARSPVKTASILYGFLKLVGVYSSTDDDIAVGMALLELERATACRSGSVSLVVARKSWHAADDVGCWRRAAASVGRVSCLVRYRPCAEKRDPAFSSDADCAGPSTIAPCFSTVA
ncbi:unnamed protein product, partial [Laminaria digitata]